MATHHHYHHTTHHSNGTSHSGHTRTHHHHKGKHHHHKKKGGSTSKALARQMLAQGGMPLSKQDAQFGQLVSEVAGELLNQGFAGLLVQAMASVVNSTQVNAPGALIAATVSSATGAIQTGGGDVTTAMCYLNGSTVPTPCYVAPHLVADLTPGCQVWVRAANGNRADLSVDSIRVFTSTPASSTYLTGSSSLSGANVTGTVANATNATNASNVPASGVTAGALGAGITLPLEQLISGSVNSINGTTAGTLFWTMAIRTTALKVVCIYLSGYENTTATPQNFVLPIDFSAGAVVITLHNAVGGTGFVFRNASGVIQSANQVVLGSAGSGGSATAHNNVFAYSLQSVNAVIHSIDAPISNTGAGTGPVFIVGF